jgi:serine/threonine-protein kinase RsbT
MNDPWVDSSDEWSAEELAVREGAAAEDALLPTDNAVLGVLRRYVSEPTAQAMIRRAKQQLSDRQAGESAAMAFFRELTTGAQMFVETSTRPVLERELEELVGTGNAARPRVMEIELRGEHDIRKLRILVRSACADVGVPVMKALRAATAVNEVAQNVLKHAHNGVAELQMESQPWPKVRCVVKDRGPGIADPSKILAPLDGEARLSIVGLRGVRRIADHFELKTGPSGTKVVIEVRG